MLSRPDEVNVTAHDAQNVRVKQEVIEAAAGRDITERLAQDIVREATKFEQAYSPSTEGLELAWPVEDIVTVTDSVVAHVGLGTPTAEMSSSSPVLGKTGTEARSS